MREYNTPINNDDWWDVFTADAWENDIKDKICFNSDGCGYWVKDNKASRDEVFVTNREDATHVVWYNK